MDKRMRLFLKILIIMSLITVQAFVFLVTADAKLSISEFYVGEGEFTAEGEIATRYEYWNWFTPSGSIPDNDYDYIFTRTRLGLGLNLPRAQAYLQVQDTHMWGLPEDAMAAAPQGPLGIGAIYYLHRGDENSHSTIIRQAYIDISKIFLEGLSTRLGRFDYVDGLEVTYENPKVNWLKNMRLAERLIGPFAWSGFCRSFDGLQVAYDQKGFNLNSTLTHPTQGGFENNAHKTMYDIDLFTLTGTVKYDQWMPNTEGRMFYFYYEDDRDIPKVDNTPQGSGLNEGAIKIHTIGAHLIRIVETESGVFDALFWGAYQTGDWGTLDHRAWATDFEWGFQFSQMVWKPWIRAGYFVSSGDSDPSDSKHETFYQLLPTARKYCLFPFYNMMNNEDLFLQAILKPQKEMAIRADLHFLSLNDENDRWYMGAGPSLNKGGIFGYIGRPSNGDDDLATVLDLITSYDFSKFLSGTLYWGHAFGKDVIENIYGDNEDGDYFYAECQIKF